ncbi:MAG: queuosine precursor transporter [Fibromonadaceae bacterium]|nr:queuosine precursor transporter [Fibromonadaceae bacterium]
MYSPTFTRLCILNVTALLISNIIAVKMVGLGPLIVPAAVFVFPITYILSGIFSEIYGYRASRISAWYAFGANLLMVVFFKITILLPGAPFWSEEAQKALEATLDGTWRILAASLAAYMIGDFVNDVIFQKMKERQGEKRFGVRTIVSSMFGNAIDSFVFITIAFWGTPLFSYAVIPSQWGIKVLYEIILLPVAIFAVKKLKQNLANAD